MGWFDEQIRQRKENDERILEESFIRIADSVTGKRLADRLNDDRTVTGNAIEEILKFYHMKSEEIPENIQDMNEQLEYAMHPHGIMHRNVTLQKGWYKNAYGAMLGMKKEDDSVIALIPDKFDHYTYYDPKIGKRIRITSRNQDMIREEAIYFYHPLPQEKMGTLSLIKYIFGTFSKADIGMLAAAACLVTLLGMLVPKFNSILFSDVVESNNLQVLGAIATFLISAKISTVLISTFQTMFMNRIKNKMDVSVQAAAMMRVMTLPPDFFKEYAAGELAGRVQCLSSISSTVVDSILGTGLTSLFSVLYILQIFKYAPGMVSTALGLLIVTVIFTIFSALVQSKVSEKQMGIAMEEQGMVYAMISGIQKIRLAGAEKRIFARWGNLYSKKSRLQYNPPLIIKWNMPIGTLIRVGGAGLLYYAALANHVSVADYYAFNSAYGMTSSAFLALTGVALEFASLKPVLEMVKPILETKPEVSVNKEMVSRVSGSIELNNVSFGYNENTPLVIDDLSLKIKPGEYLAIVGATGCGKTTLMRLLLGFEKPQKGAIYYDGKDLQSIDLQSLRKKIGVVLQSGSLFTGSVYSNIVISAPWLTEKEAWEAAEIAGMADDIRDLPMGMHTLVSEGSGGFSGGQKQRLMIARAVAGKPKILMLDEATSALDNITQKKISESLETLKCTRIVIAHRLSTIRQCDRIIMLENGKIVEDGTYEELVKENGKFAELVARQQICQGKDKPERGADLCFKVLCDK